MPTLARTKVERNKNFAEIGLPDQPENAPKAVFLPDKKPDITYKESVKSPTGKLIRIEESCVTRLVEIGHSC